MTAPHHPCKIYIGNLPNTIKESDLTDRFRECGRIESIDIKNNFAFVVSQIQLEQQYKQQHQLIIIVIIKEKANCCCIR